MQLPEELRIGLDAELEHLSAKSLAAAAAGLSQRYRSGVAWHDGFLQSADDFAAYAAFRMPATFAAVYAALEQARERLPEWQPHTMLDIGAGPGTAMWAALTHWPTLSDVTLIEREAEMISLGKRLAACAPSPVQRQVEWIRADINGAWDVPPHDLVIAAYSLGELAIDQAFQAVEKLWRLTAGVLLIIEPGTPAGYARIRRIRDRLREAGAHTVAPCPHNDTCPMKNDDWCHFSQRIQRSSLHRRVKGGELPYEDEKYSFVCVSRSAVKSIPGRVIRHPQIRKGHVRFEACAPGGLTSVVISRKDKELYRKARDLTWGSVLPE